MRWFSIASERPRLAEALREVVDGLRQAFADVRPDLVFLFLSGHPPEAHGLVADLLARELPEALLIGARARSVIGDGRELEDRPGLSITAAHLPGVELTPFHLDADDVPHPEADPAEWYELLGISASPPPHFVLLPDPFTFDPEHLLRGLDRAYPGSATIGGLASGGRVPGEHALHLGQTVYRSGMVGVALRGAIEMDTLVAQGCRPVGTPMFVTRCRENLLQELDGRPAIDLLRELFASLSPPDRELFRTSLFLGVEMKHGREEYRQGDFLIRNLVGVEADSGAIAVGAILQRSQVVQFHLRDAATSAEDLERHLARYREEERGRVEGALLFSCLGRGAHLYGKADHDTGAFRQALGEIPLGGFFCNGEIGPVQGKTFVHGYTSSFGLFRKPS